ncbi:MAG: hypothetical protein Q8N05_16715 [Bacteroidota bacterium]|nr:hypothetical protein [Bacteroidota bacterium]
MIDSEKVYIYRNQEVIIVGYVIEHNEYVIGVQIDSITQTFIKENDNKLGLWLDCFKEKDEVPVILETVNNSNLPANQQKSKFPSIYIESKENMKSLTAMLMSDIEKVRTDPGYVNQAKQVCNNVSAIVNIIKLQLQLLQEG